MEFIAVYPALRRRVDDGVEREDWEIVGGQVRPAAGDFPVQAVSTTKGGEAADQFHAGKREVTDQVERLVPGTLIFESILIVDRTAVADDQQILVCHVGSDPRPESSRPGRRSRTFAPGRPRG